MRTATICVFLCLLALVSLPISAAAQEEQPMSQTQHFLVRLLGTRPDWPENMTDSEQKIMGEHFLYLKDLTKQKKVLMAGPCTNPVFGLVVLQTASEAEAREIMDREPSVAAGLHTYDLNPLHVALMADQTSEKRTVEDPSDRILTKEVIVTASIDSVWQAWTTTEGANSFFSPNADIDLRIGGKYGIYFLMDAPEGSRGSEDCHILSFLPKKMLSFEWNAPPSFGNIRFEHTRIVLLFEELPDGKVKVTLSQLGWGKGENWDKLYDYFDKAWGYVLGNFEKRFTDGPLNWEE